MESWVQMVRGEVLENQETLDQVDHEDKGSVAVTFMCYLFTSNSCFLYSPLAVVFSISLEVFKTPNIM